MTCYAVIDTNVLVSALLSSIKHFPSKPFIVTAKEFLDILKQGRHE